MSDSFIAVAQDGTGKKMQTFLNTISGNDVHAEGVTLVDQFGNPLNADASGLFVQTDPSNPLAVKSLNSDNFRVRIDAVATDPGSFAKSLSGASTPVFDVGVPAMAIRKATPANLSDTDGDYEMLQMSEGQLYVRSPQIGDLTETAPATDTASSGLNGRLQRIAQRITTLLGIYDSTNVLLPTAGKKLAVATYSPTLFQNLGTDVTKNVKSSAGNVFSLICYNANAAARYLQLHNTATTPASSAVPILSFLVPPSGQIGIGSDIFTNEGINFATGIAFAFSTARNIYTAGTAGDQSTFIQYK